MANPITLFDLSLAISDGFVRNQRIIRLALTASVTGIMTVAFVISRIGYPDASQDLYMVNLMSIITAGLFLLEFPLAFLLSSNAFSDNALGKIVRNGITDSAGDKVKESLAIFQKAQLLKHAMMTGSAIIGCVTCLIAIFNNVLPGLPLYWFNLSPAVIFVLYALSSLPTKESITAELKTRLGVKG